MQKRINWDWMGIATSVACAIHCALLPLVLTSLPILGVNIIENKAFEFFMIFLAFAVGSFALYHGFRKHHRQKFPLYLFAAGMVLLLFKQIWHEFQYWILPFAVIFIVSAHVQNLRLCRISGRLLPRKPLVTKS
jgi:uncharacterized membrane protein YoaK (UPF0700 family)